jgi:adenylate cyclase class IV
MYDVFKINEDPSKTRSFIEIELRQTDALSISDAMLGLDNVELLLKPLGITKEDRLHRSLFEMYRKRSCYER